MRPGWYFILEHPGQKTGGALETWAHMKNSVWRLMKGELFWKNSLCSATEQAMLVYQTPWVILERELCVTHVGGTVGMAAIFGGVEAEWLQHEMGSKAWCLTEVCPLMEDTSFFRTGGYAVALFFPIPDTAGMSTLVWEDKIRLQGLCPHLAGPKKVTEPKPAPSSK